jgi:hypothetical protein
MMARGAVSFTMESGAYSPFGLYNVCHFYMLFMLGVYYTFIHHHIHHTSAALGILSATSRIQEHEHETHERGSSSSSFERLSGQVGLGQRNRPIAEQIRPVCFVKRPGT